MPPLSDQDAQRFAFTVGKAIQNYGTTEYLVNEILATLIKDPLLSSGVIQLGIARRLDILAPLVARHEAALRANGWETGSLFGEAKKTFQGRNKIAHNPYVLRNTRVDGKHTALFGIHVVRYHDEGTTEQWIEIDELESMTTAARDVFVRFNKLLGLCQRLSAVSAAPTAA